MRERGVQLQRGVVARNGLGVLAGFELRVARPVLFAGECSPRACCGLVQLAPRARDGHLRSCLRGREQQQPRVLLSQLLGDAHDDVHAPARAVSQLLARLDVREQLPQQLCGHNVAAERAAPVPTRRVSRAARGARIRPGQQVTRLHGPVGRQRWQQQQPNTRRHSGR